MRKSIMSVLLILLSFPSWSADFDKGLTAAKNGDFATALREWTPLAEQGDAFAQYQIGRILSVGRPNIPPDCEIAVIYLRKAAEQGYSRATEVLSKINNVDNPSRGMECEFKKTGLKRAIDDFSGWITSKLSSDPSDVSKSSETRLLNMAIVEGDVDAQYELGRRYAVGENVIQDFVKSHYWYNLAASLGHEGASKNRDIIAKEMTPEDISKAQQLARECVAKNYKGC